MIATVGKLAKKKSIRDRKRLAANGPAFTMVQVDRKWHIFENAAVPPGVPMYRAVCEVCHHASAWLMLKLPPTVECMSCAGDRIAIVALNLQVIEGAELHWRCPEWYEKVHPISAFGYGPDGKALPHGMSVENRRTRLKFCGECGGDVRRGRCDGCGVRQ